MKPQGSKGETDTQKSVESAPSNRPSPPNRPNNRPKEWFDDNEFWKDLYPFLFGEARFFEAPEQMRKALALTQPPGKKILDLCCGPGRCAVPLAEWGYEVTGVDRTPYLLGKARELAAQKEVYVEWVKQDMRDFVRDGAFDLVLNIFTSFGYFHDKKEDLQVLGNIYKSLKPGGVCLLDVVGKEHLARDFKPASVDVLDDGSKLLFLHEIYDDWTRIRNEWVLIRDGKAKSFYFYHTIYSGQELRDRMERAGFSEVKLYGNLEGEAYGTENHRLVAVGRR